MKIKESEKILFVFFYHNDEEFFRYQLILNNWKKLTKSNLSFKFLFVTTMKDKFLKTDFQHEYLELSEPKPLVYPKNVSLIWIIVCKHISDNIDCKYWFWWEHDMCPIKRDWLDFFDSKWKNNITKIMGSFVTDAVDPSITYINGGSFYDKDYWKFIHEDYLKYKDHFQNNRGFDAIKFYKRDDKNIVILNDWYNMITSDGFFIIKGKKFIHGIKNDTLIQLVLQKALKT